MARVTSTVSGSIASFKSPGIVPINHLKVNFEPIQEGIGDPAPDNVRSIRGRTEINITHCKRNLFDNDTSKIKQITYVNSNDETVKRYGYEFVLPPGTYTLKARRLNDSTSNRYIYGGPVKKSTRKLVKNYNIVAGTSTPVKTVTLNDDEVLAYYCATDASLASAKSYFSEFSFTMWTGTEVGDFEPYACTTIPVTFPATGKNLFDKNALGNVLNGFVSSQNGAFRESTEGEKCFILYLPEAGTYTVSKIITSRFRVALYDNLPVNNKACIAFWNPESPISTSLTITTTSPGYLAGFILNNNGETATLEQVLNSLQIEKNSSATSYESYTNTLYGGYMDLVTGKLVATWQKVVITESVSLYGNGRYNGTVGTNRFVSIPRTGIGAATVTKGYCDKIKLYKTATWDRPDDCVWGFCINASYQLHIVFDNETVGITEESTDAERNTLIKEWLATNNLTFILPLETPIVYNFSSSRIQSFIGKNNIWSDADSVEVNYDYAESVSMLEERKRIINNEPHLIEVSGSLVTFETDIIAPIEIIGQGNITITGKNMLNPATLVDPNPFTSEGITFSIDDDGIVTVDGIAGDTTSPQYRFVWDLPFSADCYFCANAPYSGTYTETYAYNVTLGQRFTKWDGVTNGQSSSSTRVLSEAHLIEGYRCGIHIRISRGSGKEFVNDKFYPMLLPGSCTDSTFEPYKGITLPVGSLFKSFKGINNIWSDNGDITVRYWTH